jgi:hypothetical protein
MASNNLRFTPVSIDDFKRAAKDVGALFRLPLHEGQELLAEIYGYKNFHDISGHLKSPHQPGPFYTEDSWRDKTDVSRGRLAHAVACARKYDQIGVCGREVSALRLFGPPSERKRPMPDGARLENVAISAAAAREGVFYARRLGDYVLRAKPSFQGPHLVAYSRGNEVGHVPIWLSVSFYLETSDPKYGELLATESLLRAAARSGAPAYLFICKYNCAQIRIAIPVEDFGQALQVMLEFGIPLPRGRADYCPEVPNLSAFKTSRAALGLDCWVKKHPRLADSFRRRFPGRAWIGAQESLSEAFVGDVSGGTVHAA